MDPPTSFKIPLLLKQRRLNRSLGPNSNINTSLNQSHSTASVLNKTKTSLPKIGINLHSYYRLDSSFARSESFVEHQNYFKPNHPLLIVDKTFFRKKDEIVTYTESFFRNKHLLLKTNPPCSPAKPQDS